MLSNLSRLVPSTILALLCCTTITHAANWPNWRGPTQNGVSTDSAGTVIYDPGSGSADIDAVILQYALTVRGAQYSLASVTDSP